MSSTDKYKILFIASWYPNRLNPLSGIFIKHHAEAISKFCEVNVLHIASDTKLSDKVYDFDYCEEGSISTLVVYYKKFHKIPLISKIVNFIRYIRAGKQGLALLEKKKGACHLIHVNVILCAGILGLIKKIQKKTPMIVTEHCSIFLTPPKQQLSPLHKFLMNIVVKNAQAITTVSSRLKYAMQKCGLSGKYYIIPNAVSLHEIRPPKKKHNDIKKIFHISLLSDQAKNISGLFRAIEKIKDTRKDFELHIIGDGNDRNMLEGLVQKLNLQKQVFFHGMQPHEEAIKKLHAADFLITNSNYETFSVVTAEALACGVPVIATKCGGPEDFVTEACGVLIEPKNNSQLENAIIYMLDNCKNYEKAKLQKYAKEKFNFESVGLAFKKVYDKVLKQNAEI